jgi:Na+-driven multidrug efflux pump
MFDSIVGNIIIGLLFLSFIGLPSIVTFIVAKKKGKANKAALIKAVIAYPLAIFIISVIYAIFILATQVPVSTTP